MSCNDDDNNAIRDGAALRRSNGLFRRMLAESAPAALSLVRDSTILMSRQVTDVPLANALLELLRRPLVLFVPVSSWLSQTASDSGRGSIGLRDEVSPLGVRMLHVP